MHWLGDNETLVWIDHVLTLCLAIGGVATAAYAKRVEKNKAPVLAAFIVVMLLAFAVTIQLQRISDREEAWIRSGAEAARGKLAAALARLDSATGEIARVQTRNAELQNLLLAQSREVSSLAKVAVAEITGGDSFAYLKFVAFDANSATPSVVHVGDAALSDIHVRILGEGDSRMALPILQHVERGSQFHVDQLGRLGSFVETTTRVPLHGNDLQRFEVFFHTPFNSWHQELVLVRDGDRWLYAFRVTGSDPKSGKQKLWMQCVHQDFPVDRLDSKEAWKRINCRDIDWMQ